MDSGRRLSEQVLKCAQNVSHGLGAGFLEKVYENALCMELTQAGIPFQRQSQFVIRYKGKEIGNYIADIVVARLGIRRIVWNYDDKNNI